MKKILLFFGILLFAFCNFFKDFVIKDFLIWVEPERKELVK